ncbi:MAG: alanine racemase [Hyphomicrobiales bacterium]|nr:alanine racemase [Hyphomicrobiales bacterium]MCP5370178.1 alanine racemase [Hyphomicrobiales bacterium]
MTLADLPTPCLVLDRPKVAANCARMAARAGVLGVRLRPHLKTAKSAEVGRLAHGGEPGPITVSTLREAEHFLDRGFCDITYAVGITPDKLDRAAALTARGADLTVLTDEPAAAKALAGHGAPFKVLVEVDCGGGRGGVDPGGEALLAVAAPLGAAGILAGVLTHAGQSYRCRAPGEIAAVAEVERAAVTAAAARLRAAGHACPVVSVGSTPTALFAESLDGVTEMRPGVYTLMDLYQASIGVCAVADIAVSVLATVIHHRDDAILVDAGGLALSMDRSTAKGPRDYGLGLACALDGTPEDGLVVAATNQEHGFLRAAAGPPPFGRFPVGSRLRILPNHACMTAAAHDHYHVIDGGTRVMARWERCNGW